MGSDVFASTHSWWLQNVSHSTEAAHVILLTYRYVARSMWTATRARRAKAGAHAAKYTQLARPSTYSSSTATHPSTTSTSLRAGIRGYSGTLSVVPHDRYPHSAMAGSGPSTTTMFCTRRIDPYSPYGTDLSTPYPSRPPSSMMSALPGSTTWACLA
ncbi:hypothetical protein BC629DRAFT_1739279 [Irpex lacteus]|nr:hypothetical protein BC629DRAFT_1739279 [Irpex lacteus]